MICNEYLAFLFNNEVMTFVNDIQNKGTESFFSSINSLYILVVLPLFLAIDVRFS